MLACVRQRPTHCCWLYGKQSGIRVIAVFVGGIFDATLQIRLGHTRLMKCGNQHVADETCYFLTNTVNTLTKVLEY